VELGWYLNLQMRCEEFQKKLAVVRSLHPLEELLDVSVNAFDSGRVFEALNCSNP